MATERQQRISIGFSGGQTLAARVAPKDLEGLQRALGRGSEGWHELLCDDGTVQLDLAAVVYVRVDSEEARVGFGA
jgi:hypothetical protein